MEISRPTDTYCVGPRLQIHLGNPEGIPTAVRHLSWNVNSLTLPDRRANRMPPSNYQGIPTCICQPRAGQLGIAKSIAEFASNNSVTMGNVMLLFYANYGYHPITTDPAPSGPLNPASKLLAHWIHAVHKESSKQLSAARQRRLRYTDTE